MWLDCPAFRRISSRNAHVVAIPLAEPFLKMENEGGLRHPRHMLAQLIRRDFRTCVFPHFSKPTRRLRLIVPYSLADDIPLRVMPPDALAMFRRPSSLSNSIDKPAIDL